MTPAPKGPRRRLAERCGGAVEGAGRQATRPAQARGSIGDRSAESKARATSDGEAATAARRSEEAEHERPSDEGSRRVQAPRRRKKAERVKPPGGARKQSAIYPRSWRRRQRSSSRSMNRVLGPAAGRAPVPPVPPVPGWAAPGRTAGHVPPAGQGPHRAGQHDHEAGYADHGELGHDTGQQQADAEQKPDRRLDDPALVVHPGILRAHRLRELRILSIERTLDLLELTLLVLRQRHGASHETSRAGTGAMTSSHGPGSSSRIRAWPLWVEG